MTIKVYPVNHPIWDFDDIEYTVISEGEGRTLRYYVAIKEAGESEPFSKKMPRRYNTEPEAWENAESELEFTVNYWATQRADRRGAVVVDATHYRIGPEDGGSASVRGYGGRSFTFDPIKDGPSVTSTNVWYQGDIPEFCIKEFPDTHTAVRY